MPAQSRTSIEEIVQAARAIVEAEGVDSLTMGAVATAVGVRGPSLYTRIRDRDDLVRRVSTAIAAELGVALREAVSGDPEADLAAMANAYRRYALAHPRAYRLLFGPVPDAWRISDALNENMSSALLGTAAALAGEEHALEAARLVVAWAHGFVSMELAGAFRLGGDVDAAFAFAVRQIAGALKASRSPGA